MTDLIPDVPGRKGSDHYAPKMYGPDPKLGEPLTDVFVLRPEKDPVALEALIRYAELTGNVYLHDDLWKWIERIRAAVGEDTT